MLRLVDSLSTHWSDHVQERNFLQQTVQVSVPPGCTPLGQPTNIGFAMPGKAACREEHDRQRYLLKLKARQQGTPAVFKVGSREILQAAKAMHDRFVSLNTEAETVIAETRACGWMHFRPDEKGFLLPADRQAWGRKHREGSSRMGPEFRQNRKSWVEGGRVVALAQEVCKEAIGGPAATEQEGDYFKPKGEGQAVLEIQAAAGFDVVEEQLRMEAALLHPRARKDCQETLAQLVLVTSQTPRKLKQQQKEPWPDRVARWKAC